MVHNDQGENAVSRLSTPDGYTLTALTTVAIVQEIIKGNFMTGFQTPATAYGSDFILEVPGCKRMDG